MVRIYKKRCDVIDLTGQVFEDLTVIEYIGKGKSRGAVWKCLCICGKECLAYGGQLRAAMRVSCGCRSQSRITQTGVNRVYGSYKAMALRRKRKFALSREEFEVLIMSNCYYCGRSPDNILKRQKTKKVQLMYNGIDRFDSTKDYISGNCVSCCYYCNHAKLDLTFDEWKEQLKRIVKWLKLTDSISD